MKSLFILAATLLAANAQAGSAKIVAKTDEGKTVVIAQDLKGRPRTNGDQNTYPSIKDFRLASDYAEYCYVGSKRAAKDLLERLVESANGDGDSYAETDSMKVDRKGVIKVVAKITDEGGERLETFKFKPCK